MMPRQEAGASVAIAETVAQAAALKSHDPSAAIVALTPLVDYWSEQSGQPVINIEDVFDERAPHTLGADVIDRVEALAGAVDRLLEPRLRALPYGGAISFAGFFHYLASVLGGVVLRLEQVLALYEAAAPQRVLAFRMGPYAFSGITSLDRAPWGLASRLMPMVAEARDVPVEWMDAPPDDPSIFNPVGSAPVEPPAPAATVAGPGSTPEIAGLRRLLRWARSLRAARAAPPAPPRPNAPMLISSLFSDLGDDVLEAWKARGGSIAGIGDAFPLRQDNARTNAVEAECEVIAGQLAGDPAVRELLKWKGIDLWPLLQGWLTSIVRAHLPPMFLRADAVWQAMMVEKSCSRAAIIAGGWVGEHYVIGRIAGRAGVPAISLHYGGFLGYSLLPKHERYDFAECDYFLCGGAGAARVLQHASPQSRWRPAVKRATPIATGMPWVERIAARRNEPSAVRARRRIMVVLNALLGDCRDLGYTFSPEISYWRFTRRAVARLAADASLEVLVKPPLRTRYPQMPSPLLDWLAAQGFTNVAVMPEIPLGECMDEADVFLLESPSTPLLHVVATAKPLLLYANRADYLLDDEARGMLARRAAVFAEDEEVFFHGLDEFLARGQWNPQAVDDDFLRQFVIGEGRASAAERIVDFVGATVERRANEQIA